MKVPKYLWTDAEQEYGIKNTKLSLIFRLCWGITLYLHVKQTITECIVLFAA